MPRPLRVHVADGIYHVILRGNNRNPIFFSNADRGDWESLIARGVARYDVRLHAFCWMTNHVHMAVQVSKTPLWDFMRWLGSRYSYLINRRYDKTGHLFERRHRAKLITDYRYLTSLIRYIHRNPIEANIVTRAVSFPWSSHVDYLRGSRYAWLTTDYILSQFSHNLNEAISAFAEFVESESEADESFNERPASPDTFPKRVATRKPNLETILETLVEVQCQKHGISRQALRSRSQCHLHAHVRGAIAYEALQAGVTLAHLSKYFNRHESVILRGSKAAKSRQNCKSCQ